MSSLFISTGGNELYKRIRDNPRFHSIKSFCEDLWKHYEPYSDLRFKEEFSIQPYPRFWEMYLGAQLLGMGCNLKPRKSGVGPDLHFEFEGKNVWVEAVAPAEGEGPDAVPKLNEHSGYKPIPDEKIILRFTNAISKKIDQLRSYIDSGVVDPNDTFIVAINGGNIEMHFFNFDDPLPLVIKAVYPVGDYSVTIDVESSKVVNEGFQVRLEILKNSGSSVSTETFLDQNYSIISGILYSSVGLLDLPNNPGDEFLYIHNSKSTSRLPIGWMGKGKDCWKVDDHLTLQENDKFA